MASDGTVTIGDINDAIESKLGAATGMVRGQSYNELTEQVPSGDLPLLQVLFESVDCEPVTYENAVQQLVLLFHADVFCRQSSNIAEDIGKAIDMADAVVDVLQAERHLPYFDLHGIKDMRWRADRVIFDYAGVTFAGIRFYITIYVF